MAFQVSPGVNVSEFDLTTVVPAPGGTYGAYAGKFNWGPIGVVQPIDNELKLAERFGKPSAGDTGNNATSFFTCANFLAYSGSLLVSRATAYNSTNSLAPRAGGSPVARLIANSNDYSNNSTISDATFAARYAGTLGDNLSVHMWANNSINDWTFGTYFDRAPSTTNYINDRFGDVNDELYIVVVDRTGALSGTPNTVLEKYSASKATNARDENNNSNYYKDVLFNKSRWVYQVGDPATIDGNVWSVAANTGYVFPNLATDAANVAYDLTAGHYSWCSSANVEVAYDLFKDPSYDVSLIMTGKHTSTVVNYVIDNVADLRKDCVVFASPPLANVQAADPATSIAAYRETLSFSSYGVLDSGWKYQYDKYNDVYRYIPLNGDIAGLCARTDEVREPWFSPAGVTRGQIKNIVKLAYNPNQADRDTLYKSDVNPVVNFVGEGTFLYGDKTLLGRQSAFDRINVRRLFIQLEKVIASAAKLSLFEFNDDFTRSQFVSLVDPYLRSVLAGRGIYDYRVVCDERNNTADVIDRNEFVGDIYIKPARSINFIQLNFVALRSGVSFDEIIGRF